MARDGTGGWRLSPGDGSGTWRCPIARLAPQHVHPASDRHAPAGGDRTGRLDAVLNAANAATRRTMRELRRSLPSTVRRSAESAICNHLRRIGVWRRNRRIAAYLAFGGEVDLRRCFDDAWRRGAKVYVPRVTRRRERRMTFVPLTAATAFRKNSYGIAEPAQSRERQIFLRELDVVLLPMVAFDARGHRLGMGAGYYDRALQRRRERSRAWRRPLLVGIAFSFQEVAAIEPASWDVALDLVVTERGVLRCASSTPDGRPR